MVLLDVVIFRLVDFLDCRRFFRRTRAAVSSYGFKFTFGGFQFFRRNLQFLVTLFQCGERVTRIQFIGDLLHGVGELAQIFRIQIFRRRHLHFLKATKKIRQRFIGNVLQIFKRADIFRGRFQLVERILQLRLGFLDIQFGKKFFVAVQPGNAAFFLKIIMDCRFLLLIRPELLQHCVIVCIAGIFRILVELVLAVRNRCINGLAFGIRCCLTSCGFK